MVLLGKNMLYALIGFLTLFLISMGIIESNRAYAVTFCIIHLLSVYIIWINSGSRVGIFLLFTLTFGLFIGGRFYANLLGIDEDIFEMFFFIHHIEDYSGRITLMIFVISYLLFSSLGYIFSYNKKIKPIYEFQINQSTIMIFNKFALLLYPIFLLIVLYSGINALRMVLDGGYLALYDGQTDSYTAGGNFMQILLQFFFAICIAWGDKKNKFFYIVLFVISSTLFILMGTRSAFGSLLLFFLWLYSQYKKISLVKLALCIVGGVIFLLLVFSLSIRSLSNESSIDFSQAIGIFLYAQGISLMVFDFSTFPQTYPTLPYIQSIVPASSFFYSIMTDTTLYPENVSFASYLSNYINPEAFAKGYGLGWTLISDLYLFSGRTVFGFIFLSAFFGWMIGNLECWSTSNKFYLFIQAMIIFPFLILPRAGLNTILPLIIYSLLFLVVLYFISNIITRVLTRH